MESGLKIALLKKIIIIRRRETMQYTYLTEDVLAYFEQTSQNPEAIVEVPTSLSISASYDEQELVGHFDEQGQLQGALPALYIQCNIKSLTPAQIGALRAAYAAFHSMTSADQTAYVADKLKAIPVSGRDTTFPIRFENGRYLPQGRLADRKIAKGGFHKAENEFIAIDSDGALAMFEVVTDVEDKKVAKRLYELPEKYFRSAQFKQHTDDEASSEDPLTVEQRKIFRAQREKEIPADGRLFYANFVAQPPMCDQAGNSFLRFSIVPQGKGGHYEISGLASLGAGVFVGAMLPNGEVETLLVAMNSGGWRDEEARISCLTLLAGKRGLILPFDVPSDGPLPLYRMPLSAQVVPEECAVVNGLERVDLRSMGKLVEDTVTPSPAGKEKTLTFDVADDEMPAGLELLEGGSVLFPSECVHELDDSEVQVVSRVGSNITSRQGSITVEEIMAVQVPNAVRVAEMMNRLVIPALPLQPLNCERRKSSSDGVVYRGSSDALCIDSPKILGSGNSPFTSLGTTVSTRKSISFEGDENNSPSLFSPQSMRARGCPYASAVKRASVAGVDSPSTPTTRVRG